MALPPDPRKWEADDRVQWHGVTMDRKSAVMLDRVQKRLDFYVRPSQGSYSDAEASAGTHTGSGAIDVITSGLTFAQKRDLLRALKIEFGAAWLRRASSSWPEHIHAGAMGSPEPDEWLAKQIVGYKAGRDGLGPWPFGVDPDPWRPSSWPSLNFAAYKRRKVLAWRYAIAKAEVAKALAVLTRKREKAAAIEAELRKARAS